MESQVKPILYRAEIYFDNEKIFLTVSNLAEKGWKSLCKSFRKREVLEINGRNEIVIDFSKVSYMTVENQEQED